MKNHSNVTANPKSGDSITLLVVFEVTTALSAITIIITSSLVLRHIYGKVRRSRADLLFIILSISDIGVGLLSQTVLGIVRTRIYKDFHKTVVQTNHLFIFFVPFPYIFSFIVTAIVAIDRLFLVTKQHCYTNFITKRRLACIVAFFFIISVGHCTWMSYAFFAYRRITELLYLSMIYKVFNVTLSIMVTGAYIFILCFSYRRAKAVSHCKSNGNKDFKRLTKTIMFIFVSQVIFNFPVQCFMFIPLDKIYSIFSETAPELMAWIYMLRNNSSLFNGVILLLRERRKKKNKRKIEKETGFLKDLKKVPSA